MVGMSKSGSRYGRRSNWFKIHCLLQEQQQQQQAAAAAAAAGNRKTPPSSSSSINMLGHSNYPPSLYSRPTTKEELMLLGFEDYNNHNSKRPSASPSVSSPDSHNSDSSVEVGDRRQSLLRQSQAHQQNRGQLPPPPFNKELFLPLSFPGLMPPPGFLPPSHLMFPGYHPALYAQHQGLLKPAVDSVALLNSAQSMANNNSRFVPNNNCGKTFIAIYFHLFILNQLKSNQFTYTFHKIWIFLNVKSSFCERKIIDFFQNSLKTSFKTLTDSCNSFLSFFCEHTKYR